MSPLCSSEKRLPYWAKMVSMRASTSAWLSGESFGRFVGCCGSGLDRLLEGEERRPRKSGAATVAGALDRASVVASATAGATVATAEAMAARRANSRREMPPDLVVPGLDVSAIRTLRFGSGRGSTEEATESRGERQQRRRGRDGKEARRKTR